MKIAALFFIFVSFALAKAFVASETNANVDFEFPELHVTTFDFIDLSAGCAGFVDCLEYIGAVIYNFVIGIIFLVLFIVQLLIYLFELIGLLISLTFTGIDGAPGWLNILLTLPFLAALAFIIFRLLRKGASSD